MAYRIEDCVNEVVAICSGQGTEEERRGRAALRINYFLADLQLEGGNMSETAQRLRDRLDEQLDSSQRYAKPCLDVMIGYLDDVASREPACSII